MARVAPNGPDCPQGQTRADKPVLKGLGASRELGHSSFPSAAPVPAWNLEPGTWNLELEPGTWNLEPGPRTWNLDLDLELFLDLKLNLDPDLYLALGRAGEP